MHLVEEELQHKQLGVQQAKLHINPKAEWEIGISFYLGISSFTPGKRHYSVRWSDKSI